MLRLWHGLRTDAGRAAALDAHREIAEREGGRTVRPTDPTSGPRSQAGPSPPGEAPVTLASRSRFGTPWGWMGAMHFRMRRLGNEATEMGFLVLAYGPERVMAALGTGPRPRRPPRV